MFSGINTDHVVGTHLSAEQLWESHCLATSSLVCSWWSPVVGTVAGYTNAVHSFQSTALIELPWGKEKLHEN